MKTTGLSVFTTSCNYYLTTFTCSIRDCFGESWGNTEGGTLASVGLQYMLGKGSEGCRILYYAL